MTLSNRTKISLSQFLELLKLESIKKLFEKYAINSVSAKENVKNAILETGDNTITELVVEVIGTQGLRNDIEKKYFFDGTFVGRWNDLEKCLLLDGYKINNDNTLIKIEPNIEGVTAFEDELTNELKNSNLSVKQDIINLIENSANAFKHNQCNDCLTNARMALETLVRKITSEKFNENKDWQGAIETLKNKEFLTEKEKWLIKNTYSFISEACHNFLQTRNTQDMVEIWRCRCATMSSKNTINQILVVSKEKR